MKTRNFLWGAMGLLAMASCSNDELVNVNHDGDEIAFNVVTNASTRAHTESGGVYCNNNLPGSFKVWATIEEGEERKTYIDGDVIEKSGSSWKNTNGTRYWPETGFLDFYASVNANDANYVFNWDDNSNPTINVTVPTNVEQQKDLLYAVKKGQTKADNSGQDEDGKDKHVTLNFRHALSQVVFQAKNTNSNLYVRISGVSVCKLGETNTFTYPANNTDNNIVNHYGTEESINYNDGSWGSWPNMAARNATYTISFDNAVNVAGDNTPVSLTNTNESGKEYSKKAMLLLPQTTDAWITSGANAKGKPADQTGTYFLVKCQIWNVADGTGEPDENDVCLWGKNGAEDIAIPVKLEWKQGKKYLYTFVFGEGNGGYHPDPNPDDPAPKPTPILVPITFNVTVDDFIPVEYDIPHGVQGVTNIVSKS